MKKLIYARCYNNLEDYVKQITLDIEILKENLMQFKGGVLNGMLTFYFGNHQIVINYLEKEDYIKSKKKKNHLTTIIHTNNNVREILKSIIKYEQKLLNKNKY